MAETLLAILLVTTSANESNLVYRWPEHPQVQPRLSRPRPDCTTSAAHLDNVWKASHYGETEQLDVQHEPLNDPPYEWKRTSSHSRRRPSNLTSGNSAIRHTSSTKRGADAMTDHQANYDTLFGYSSSFLANLLCPQRSMCHQRCELLVDDLTFIGHPVSVDANGQWRFRLDKQKSSARGRETRSVQASHMSSDTIAEESPDRESFHEQTESSNATWLTAFNFVLVLDQPDPSSSASGNFLKYLDVIYKQIAFAIMAVLFQQQVSSNFVETECEALGSLREACVSKGQPADFHAQALQVSSIAIAMKTLYESIKTSSIAYITIDNIPLELQLPPFLDQLLHSEDEDLVYEPLNQDDAAYYKQTWGEELSEPGWNLPSLEPWKSLLMLDPSLNLQTPYIDHEDRMLVEGLVKFMGHATDVTLSLGDMASLLDWDYDTQVIPTVRWLVLHRRAKVVDVVHRGLKTVFTLPPKLRTPLKVLVEDFEHDFSVHPEVSSLPEIMSAISTSPSQNHFFATVVQSKELVPIYNEVVVWMLKRELLVTLHLRVRVVATEELKQRVKHRIAKDAIARERARKLGQRGRSKLHREIDMEAGSPPAATTKDVLLPIHVQGDEQPDEDEDEPEQDDSGWETNEYETKSSIIPDPARANARQTRWLMAMSEGKDAHMVDRFNQLFPYFDGKHTDDEILFKAEMTRKALRQILHHYDEYLQTFLHP